MTTKKQTVLVADDDPRLLKLIQRNLELANYRILAYLARNAGRVVTQDDLLTKVWGPAYRDEAHLLRVNIARLRQKVEPEPSNPKYVITRPGIGYSLTRVESSVNGQS